MTFYSISWESPKKSLESLLERMKAALTTAEADAAEYRTMLARAEGDAVSLKEKIEEFVKHIEGIL